ncbi:sulfatase [Flavobacterium nackdongense]|uniref:Iduronate-2-sulfatase n=1 Tax=Flavobacterium nackdongense TaxID=2547394 RepID=A0A4P6YHV9_9FLAO|nr:sulfatase-like hydrolase/transferase [Flavobacterium nackdongense]QBN20477.1 iduronate-2-sulfatase [Flavobacterium nackdongense]
MKNKKILIYSFLVLFLAIGSFAQKTKKESKLPQKKYNVLFIAVDDLNDWVGFLDGNPQTLTPNMDRLAKQSMVFDRAYCTASVCNPSRAAILSGLKPSTTKIYGNGDKAFDLPIFKDTQMLPQYFAANGYETFSRGKIYHTPATGKETWANWENISGNYGKAVKKEGLMANGIPKGEMDDNMDWYATEQKTEDTPDYLNAKWAAEKLAGDFEKPFFIACGIFRPHLEWNVPKEFYDKFPLDKIVLPSVLETDLDDVGDKAKPSKDYLTIKKYGKQKEVVQAYLACVNYADYCIGQMLDALEKSKYKDNTIVVLWGDHGWHLGEKLRYKKFTLWEEACRVPLIIKAPNVTTPGSRSGRTVNLLDLYPTLIELTGLPKNEKNEGISIVPILKNPKVAWDHPSLTQMGEGRNTIRTEKWRYIRYNDNSEELYNHENDALEWVNLANKPEYATIKAEMSKKMDVILKK